MANISYLGSYVATGSTLNHIGNFTMSGDPDRTLVVFTAQNNFANILTMSFNDIAMTNVPSANVANGDRKLRGYYYNVPTEVAGGVYAFKMTNEVSRTPFSFYVYELNDVVLGAPASASAQLQPQGNLSQSMSFTGSIDSALLSLGYAASTASAPIFTGSVSTRANNTGESNYITAVGDGYATSTDIQRIVFTQYTASITFISAMMFLSKPSGYTALAGPIGQNLFSINQTPVGNYVSITN